MSEFKTIRNIVSQVLGHRVPEGGYAELFQQLDIRGEIQGKEISLILAIIMYLDAKEKESLHPLSQ